MNTFSLTQVNLRQSSILEKLFDLMNYCWRCPIRLKATYQYFAGKPVPRVPIFKNLIKFEL